MRVLFINGHIWQSQLQHEPHSSWLLICGPEDGRGADGKVIAVGNGDPPEHCRADSNIIDLKGAVVLPGLQDAHIHIGCMGESAHYVELSACRSSAEVQQTIRRHAESNPDLPWVIGTGWDQNLWSPAKPLTKLDLDAALPDGRPCLLYRRCWHAAAVNSAALRAASFDPDAPWSPPSDDEDVLTPVKVVPPPDKNVSRPTTTTLPSDSIYPPPENSVLQPNTSEILPQSAAEGSRQEVARGGAGKVGEAGGERAGKTAGAGGHGGGVEVDGAGRPTGLFREGSMRLVETAITAPSFEIRCEQYAEALERCVSSGLTAVHSNDENAVEVYVRLQEEGRLPVRVYLTLPHDELDKEQPVVKESVGSVSSGGGGNGGGGEARKPKPWAGDGGLVSWNRVKLFSDGSLGAETAAMRLPYLGTDNKGVLIHERAALTQKVAQARDRGFRVEVHAIGDRALAAVLDAFEEAGLTAEDRPIVTHCQVAGPDLVARMARLGAVAAVQPSFVPSDAAVVVKRLSPSVHASCYPWRSLLRGGVTCAGSSDAPIESHDPFRGMFDAVYRPNMPPSPPGSVLPGDGSGETKNSSSSSGGGSSDSSGSGGSGNGSGGATPFFPDESLTLEEAVWLYTAGGAVAAGAEDRLGAIRPGLLADLTIVEVEGGGEKLLENPRLLLEAKVSQVWVGGLLRMIGPDVAGEKAVASQVPSPLPSLGRSGLPGKNGPKRKRIGSTSGAGTNPPPNNPWLSGGIGRMGRCRCCS